MRLSIEFTRLTALALGVLFSVGIVDIVAATTTHSQEEMERFRQFSGQFVSETAEDHWYVITGLEQLLKDYPNTFLKGDISVTLLRSYSQVTDDKALLTQLADNVFALRGNTHNSYQVAASVFVEKGIRLGKTLLFAQKAMAGALEKQKKWGDYGTGVLREQTLLARAYQLVGQHQKAVSEIQLVIKGWQLVERENLSSEIRQASVDRARLRLLKFYVEEKSWHDAYRLATELLQTSVVREDVVKLWNAAYVGRFGSAKGMAGTYAKLNGEWETKIAKRVEGERISKPAPMFAVKTLEGETIQLTALKGKPVVVTFWAGWCSPCIEELPHLSRLKARFRDVEFLAINIDEESNMRRDMVIVNRYQRGRGLTFVLGDVETRKAFGSKEIPYTCVIDGEGNIRYERKGMGTDFSTAMAHQLTWVLSEEAAP